MSHLLFFAPPVQRVITKILMVLLPSKKPKGGKK